MKPLGLQSVGVGLCSGVLLLGLVLLLFGGCARRQTPVGGYFGPTDPIEAVLAEIDRNNRALPTLWLSGRFEAWIAPEPGAEPRFVNGTINLVHAKPLGLLVRARKDLAGDLFEIGSNDERYWLIVREDGGTLWTGTHAAGRPDPREIPIPPAAIIDVLGVSDMSLDLLTEPFPVMRFNNDSDAYMIVWHETRGDRVVARREAWFDRQTKRPSLVLLFDDWGRIVLRSYLRDHAAVSGAGGAVAPRRLELFFPQTRSSMTIDVEEARLSHNNVPNDRSFRFPRRELERLNRVINLDPARE